MKLIVCGAGQVGHQIARHLSDEGNSVTVIDINPNLVRQVTDSLDVSGVVGFASHPGVLALRFGFMHDIDVHGGIHGDIRSCCPIRGLTRP